MKSKVTRGFLTSGLILMVMAVFLLPPNGYAENYEIESNDILGEALIWDLSGSYSGEFFDFDLTYDIFQDGKGKITGSQHVVCDGYLDGYYVDMEFDLDIKGKIKQKNGVATVKINTKIKGTADVPYEDIWGAKMSGKQKITATIDPDSLTLIGTIQEKVSIKGHSIKETDNFSLPLPSGMDGTWSLEIDVNDDGKNMVGNSQMELSNGEIRPFSAKGKYKAKTNETKFTLKGTGNASGCKLSPVINEGTGDVSSIKGKVLGQKISVSDSGGNGGGASDSKTVTSESFSPMSAPEKLKWVYRVNNGESLETYSDGFFMSVGFDDITLIVDPSKNKRTGTVSGKISGDANGSYKMDISEDFSFIGGSTYFSNDSLKMTMNISAEGESGKIVMDLSSTYSPAAEWFLDRDDLDQLDIGYTYYPESVYADVTGTVKITGYGTIPIDYYGYLPDRWEITGKQDSITVQGKTFANIVEVTRYTEIPNASGTESESATIIYWVAKGIGWVKASGHFRFQDEPLDVELVDTNLVAG